MNTFPWLHHAQPPVPPTLRAPIAAALERGLLPALEGVEPARVARWLYRAAMVDAPRWGPLAVVDPRRMGAELAPEELLRTVAGGWLVWIPAGPPTRAVGEVTQLSAQAGPGLPASLELVAALGEADAHFLVATDPALEEPRRALAAHVAAAGVVLLCGPPGTGKVSLAAWAHAGRDDRPLSVVYPGGPTHPTDGCWTLFEEVSELSANQGFALRSLLERRSRRQVPRPALGGRSRPDHPAFQTLQGESAALAEVLHQAVKAAPTNQPVLILGEPGTGKELMARALHDASGRRGEMVSVYLSPHNTDLLEGELQGWDKGAHSTAEKPRKGVVRAADKGTLFMDELGNLSLAVQARLLRLLAEQVVQPLGSDVAIPVSVRVIAATNAPVEEMADRGEFRADLLSRLNAFVLRMPPLRERGDDVLLLAEARWREKRPGLGADWATPAARDALLAHTWPGNVRELNAIIEAAAALGPPGPLRAEDLGPLAPKNQRRVPLLATHSGEEPPVVEGLLRPHLHALTAVTLRLPPLAARGAASLRHALLFHLSGIPVRADALALLESLPWRGDGPQLAAVAGALRAGMGDGPIDAAAVRRLQPDLKKEGKRTIRALMHPSVRADGELNGWIQDFDEAGVVIGRVRSLGELTRDLGKDHPRVSAIRERLGSAQPGCLVVGNDPQVSRAQALVVREGDDLLVVGLPGVGGTRAGPIDGPMRTVGHDRPVSIGAAGRVEVGPAANPILRVWLFAGAVAFAGVPAERLLGGEGSAAASVAVSPAATAAASPAALAAASAPGGSRTGGSREKRDAASGLGGSRSQRSPEKAASKQRTRRLWMLDAAEIALLNGLIMDFRGGDFSGWLEAGLRAASGPAGERLRGYLVGSRSAQYCVRLFKFSANIALREDLVARMGPNPVARRRLLPIGMEKELFAPPAG